MARITILRDRNAEHCSVWIFASLNDINIDIEERNEDKKWFRLVFVVSSKDILQLDQNVTIFYALLWCNLASGQTHSGPVRSECLQPW